MILEPIAGIFWDRNNGEGEEKLFDANISTASYLAPDGSAWKVSKATFKISENLLFGEKTWRILYWKVQMLFRWMSMGILRLQKI